MEKSNTKFMDSVSKLTDKIAVPLTKIASMPIFESIQEGMLGIMSIMIIGSVFIILYTISDPEMINGITWFAFLQPYSDKFYLAYTLSTGFLALYASLAVSMAYAERLGVDVKNGAIIGVSAFLYMIVGTFADAEWATIDIEFFGAGGLFTALITSVLVIRIFKFCNDKNIKIKMPAGVPSSVESSFAAIIPFVISITVVWVLRSIIGFDFTLFFYNILEPLVSAADNIFSYTALMTLMETFWSVGLHGDIIVYSFYAPLLTLWDTTNVAAFASGIVASDLPHIWTQGFEYMGASYFPLIFLMWKSPVKQFRSVAKIAAPALFFNITEPILFGLPIALNPFLIIPSLLNTVIGSIIKYGATQLGLVNRFFMILPWATPPIIGSPLSTGDWRTIPLIILLFFVGLVIYYPFFKAYEKYKLAEQNEIEAKEALETVVQ